MVENLTCSVDYEDYLGLDEYFEGLLLLANLTNTDISVYDLHHHSFLFHSVSDKESIRHPMFAWKAGLASCHYSGLIHPDDLSIVFNAHLSAHYTLEALSAEEKSKLVLGTLFRVQNGRGGYRLMYFRMAIGKLDRNKNPWLLLIHSTLLADTAGSNVPRGYCLSSIGRFKQQPVFTCNDLSVTVITSRELQLLGLIIAGYENYQIAEMLNISPDTVDKHRSNLEHHIGAKDMSQAIVFAMRLGLV
jgi:DNA-binding CsgD family transcriptional regulator